MIELVTNAAADALASAHRTLLVPSFRPAELLSEHDFLAQFGTTAESVLALDEDGRMLGIAVVERFRDAVLLQYLATAPEARGRGVGSELIKVVLRDWAPQGCVLLVELDRPDAQPAHPLQGDPTARLRFYARFGALALDLPYFQPAVSAKTGREHGMLLAVFDLYGAMAALGRLTAAQRNAVQAYVANILDGADDRDALRLRDAAAGDRGIRVLPLDQYAAIARSPMPG